MEVDKNSTLYKVLLSTVRSAWEDNRSRYTDYTPYAVVFYGVDDSGPNLFPAILSEECLTKAGQRYVNQGRKDTLEEGKNSFRYSVPDSDDGFLYEDKIQEIDQAINDLPDESDEEDNWYLVIDTAIEALAELDAEGLFGTGESREKLLIGIMVDVFLDGINAKSIKRLNPPVVYERFDKQTKRDGVYKSCHELSITSDGSTILTRCVVPDKNSKYESESIVELVCLKNEKSGLRRIWEYQFSSRSECPRFIATSNQSCHFWAVGNRDVNNASQTFIQKYSDKSNKPIAEFLVDGGSSASSVSQDGLRLALFMENTVSIFDESLRLEKQISIDEMSIGESTLFLNNGEFLVTNTSGIQIIKLSGNIEASPITEEGLFCTIDASESLLAVGKGQYNRLTQDNTIGIYKFPDFDLLTELKYKGHTLKRPRISSDGQKVASEANRLHGDRKSVVLFDVDSGELIAEYKSDDIRGMEMVPDAKTLAIAEWKDTNNEPIYIWNITE